MVTRANDDIFKKKVPMVHKVVEPHTFIQVSKDLNWLLAMEKEFTALIKNNTWHLVPTPNNNIIDYKWVYKLKYKPNGAIDRYKSHLVAKEFNQTLGLYYFETFNPIVKASTIRIVLAIALSFQWSIRQLVV